MRGSCALVTPSVAADREGRLVNSFSRHKLMNIPFNLVIIHFKGVSMLGNLLMHNMEETKVKF